MAQEQRIHTPLVESAIKVEPATPPGMSLNTRVQRVWSLLFGRRENTLQPVYASRGGMLGTVDMDLNGWKLIQHGHAASGWFDLGEVADFVMFGGITTVAGIPYVEFGMETGIVTHVSIARTWSTLSPVGAEQNGACGHFHGRCRWFNGVNIFAVNGYVVAYVAPKR